MSEKNYINRNLSLWNTTINMSMTMMNKGPGYIDAIIVNGKPKWKNVKFEKYCKVVVGEYVEIDGKEYFRAGKNDKFYLSSISTTPSNPLDIVM